MITDENILAGLHEDLLQAIEMRDLDYVKDMIEGEDADVCFNLHEPLRKACEHSSLAIVKYLVSRKAFIHVMDGAPLRIAVQNHRNDIVKYLLSIGANPNLAPAYDPIEKLRRRNHVRELLEDAGYGKKSKQRPGASKGNLTALTEATLNNNIEGIKLLIDAGADARSHNNSALRYVTSEDAFSLIGRLYDVEEIKTHLKEFSMHQEMEPEVVDMCLRKITIIQKMKKEFGD